jgi:hypothetical protein
MPPVPQAVKTEPIRFLDLRDRVEPERKALDDELLALARVGAAKSADANKLRRLKQNEFDRLYAAVDKDLDPGNTTKVRSGIFSSQIPPSGGRANLKPIEKQIAAVYGILVRDHRTNPRARGFSDALSLARSEYNANKALYDEVLEILVKVGDQHDPNVTLAGGKPFTTDDVRESDWVAVAQKLARRKVEAGDLYLEYQVEVEVNARNGSDGGAPPSSLDIDLPDLDAGVDVEIVVANLHAMQAMYFSAMLEEIKLFQVADKLVEQFHQGVLPLGRGNAGNLLFRYWKASNDRFTEVERNNLYARAFGLPGGDPMLGSANREFNSLWLRFVSAVSSFTRQVNVDDLLRAQIPAAVSQEQVRKSGRDLAATLSLYGYGVAYFAATDLQQQINDILEILRDEEIQKAYGARDEWQVVDQVAALELGGIRMSTVRGRTMAKAGAVIIRWLAKKSQELGAVGGRSLLDESLIRDPNGQGTDKPMKDPNDKDLVIACEQWIAVTGTPDVQVEEYSQPIETPAVTSRPIQIPQAARDLLESVGVGMPMSAGNGGRSR